MRKYAYGLPFALCLLCVCSFAQNVGINTTGSAPSDPKAMLEIRKAGFSKIKTRSENFFDTSVLELSNRNAGSLGTDLLFSLNREEGLLISSASDLTGNTKDSLLSLRITSGNLGIGIKNPAYPMQLHTPSSPTSYMSFTNNTTGVNAAHGLIVGINGSSAALVNLENGNLRLGTNNLTRMLIDGSGNVGVGTLSPAYKLDVNGDLNLTGSMRINGSAGTAGQVLTSNGVADPQWKTTALSNNTRFAFDVSLTSPATSLGSTGGYMNFVATKYNLDPSSVSISGVDLTITKTGLYHFEFFYNVQFYYASAATSVSPKHQSYISINYAGGFNHDIAYYQDLRRDGTSNGWYYNAKASLDVYIQAPRTIHIISDFTNLAGPTNSVLQDGQFYGHLISD